MQLLPIVPATLRLRQRTQVRASHHHGQTWEMGQAPVHQYVHAVKLQRRALWLHICSYQQQASPRIPNLALVAGCSAFAKEAILT